MFKDQTGVIQSRIFDRLFYGNHLLVYFAKPDKLIFWAMKNK